MPTQNFVDPKRNGAVFPTDKARADENWRRSVPQKAETVSIKPANTLTAKEVVAELERLGWALSYIGPAIGKSPSYAKQIKYGNFTGDAALDDLLMLMDEKPQSGIPSAERHRKIVATKTANQALMAKSGPPQTPAATDYSAIAIAINKQADDFARLASMVKEIRADVDALRSERATANPSKRIIARLDAIERQLATPETPEPVRLPWWRRIFR